MPHFGTVEDISHVSSLSKVDGKFLSSTMAVVPESEVVQTSPLPFVAKTELTVTQEEQTKTSSLPLCDKKEFPILKFTQNKNIKVMY